MIFKRILKIVFYDFLGILEGFYLNFKKFGIVIFGQILRNQNMNFYLNFAEF